MHAIVLLPLVPLRLTPTESSEMVSQLLYGETIEVLEQQNNWLYICNIADNYSGWVDKKMIKLLTQEQFMVINPAKKQIIDSPTLSCQIEKTKQHILLPGAGIVRKNLFLEGVDELNLIQSDEKDDVQYSKSVVEIA